LDGRRASSAQGAPADGNPHTKFAAHVHEVIGMNRRSATLPAIETRIESMTPDTEEQSALWLLAWSLREQQGS
jgi:hypothetical protein